LKVIKQWVCQRCSRYDDSSIAAAFCFGFWPKAVGGQLADDLARSGRKTGDGGRSGSTEMSDSAAASRQIIGKPASTPWRAEAGTGDSIQHNNCAVLRCSPQPVAIALASAGDPERSTADIPWGGRQMHKAGLPFANTPL